MKICLNTKDHIISVEDNIKQSFDAVSLGQAFIGAKEGFTGITNFKISATKNLEVGWQAGTVLKIYGR